MPQTSDYKKQWDKIRAFLESPTHTVFDYREKKEERRVMEDAIASVQIDLTIQTIRKGSPHTLRLTKTQESYMREMEEWKQDVNLLNLLEGVDRKNR